MSGTSSLLRVQNRFFKAIQAIKEERERLGLPKISLTKISSLITRHAYWGNIQADIINYIGEEDED